MQLEPQSGTARPLPRALCRLRRCYCPETQYDWVKDPFRVQESLGDEELQLPLSRSKNAPAAVARHRSD